MDFEWDLLKNASNTEKHGVSFEEAKEVFYDEFAIEFYDEIHSDDEDRFIMVGLSEQTRVLLVCHCFREPEEVIRIISARKATPNEADEYWSER